MDEKRSLKHWGKRNKISGLRGRFYTVHGNSIQPTVNSILLNWRDLWPGGLDERAYSTLNLLALCRKGPLGFNSVQCKDCRHSDWFASSCGNRHCPNCLGPRQAQWAEEVCQRLPDCPHFHVVFTLPEEIHEFFELNYRTAADILFSAAAETLKTFQKNNWQMDGGFLAVLHTWGSALNWHPHLHVLVSAGGRDRQTGRWKRARDGYLFPVRSMSKVFRSIFLRELETLDARRDLRWPPDLDTLERRRQWRVVMCGRHWNIFSRPTLGNTRAVVRYLARYTSRIAMSNSRIKAINEEQRTVTFESKDYRNGGRKHDLTLSGGAFLHRFCRHLVPRNFRRVRSYGLLCGERCRHRKLPGAPQSAIGEKALPPAPRACPKCGSEHCRVFHLRCRPGANESVTVVAMQLVVRESVGRYSLVPPDSG